HDGHQGDPKAVPYALEVSGGSTNVYHQAVFSKTSGQHDDEWCKPDWDGWQGRGLEAALVAQEAERYKRALFGLLADIQSGSEDQLCDILATVQKERTLSEAVRSVLDRSYKVNHKCRGGEVQEAAPIQSRCRRPPGSRTINSWRNSTAPEEESKPMAKPLRHSLGGSDPVPCNCSLAIQEVRGRAILTVESSGLKPAYYLTFVPDAILMLPQTPPTDTSGKQRPYTSDENALLVRLKEREGMPWAEIAAHIPERSASSLQVHYSTKLRHKATTRAEKLRIRR
ncbi:hypothetical protein KXV74_007192, partial [Aspergillus fumigatus]